MFNLVTNRCIRYCQSEKEISVSRGNSVRNAGGVSNRGRESLERGRKTALAQRQRRAGKQGEPVFWVQPGKGLLIHASFRVYLITKESRG